MSTDPAGTAEGRDRREKADNFIVLAVSVTLFIVLEVVLPKIVKMRMAELGMEPDVRTAFVILVIIVAITAVFGWLLNWLLRWWAGKKK